MARAKHIVGSVDVVAFPSYHALTVLLIYFFIRDIKLFLINHLYLIYTIFLMFAVVILAEHFFADIVGALIFFTISVGLLKLLGGRYKVK